ncbi:MAG: hypothetical protein OHK0036_01930 [Bacteroidia bacterium]
MIEIIHLHKSFKHIQVLNDINLLLEKNKTYAILGPNGSGKTTLMKSILGLIIPDSGKILFNGENIKNNFLYRDQIGYLPQIAKFPDNLNIRSLIKMIEDIRGKKGNWEYLSDYFQLNAHIDKSMKSLSGGMKQKVNVILSLMFNPDVIIMDEPTVGLDPVSRVKFKELIKSYKQNRTIFFCTHLLSEVEELADEIIFILDGKIFYRGTPSELLLSYQESSLEKSIAKLIESNIQN